MPNNQNERGTGYAWLQSHSFSDDQRHHSSHFLLVRLAGVNSGGKADRTGGKNLGSEAAFPEKQPRSSEMKAQLAH